MINANTEIGRSMYDAMQLDGNVIIAVPDKLKPLSKEVLTQELGEILKALDKIDPDIIIDAQKMLIEYVQNEVDDGSREN